MSETVDAAWEALRRALIAIEDINTVSTDIARHRPRIEAAIRAESDAMVSALQSEFADDWRIAVGYARTTDCRFCPGWWATATGPRDPDTRFPLIISSETGRPRGEHHDSTVAGAVAALRAHLPRAALSNAAPEDADA